MNPHHQLNRRHFIRGVGASVITAPLLSAGVQAAQKAPTMFTHGVASGDPLSDRVIIWTRVMPTRAARVPVLWEVAADADFNTVLRRGRAFAVAANDHTVKVDVLGLPADQKLYYRFRLGADYSPVGQTKTLPEGSVEQIKLVVFSCSNYPAGYFHAYAEAALLADVDAAIHLGDYIYEYSSTGYASEDSEALDRVSVPANEILTVADYRLRYAQYRSDPDLQAAHAAMPFICVWDDHELANDSFKNGAQNHNEATEGPFAARRAAAMKVYHEWMPIRTPDTNRLEKIYRSFNFGNLVDLHMLDTRNIGRDKQLSYANYNFNDPASAAQYVADLSNPMRQLLGTEQMSWLTSQFQSSNAKWTVLGQQVLIGRMNVPAPLVLFQVSFTDYVTALTIAATNPAALTPTQRAILAQPAIPYNLDAWDGYAVAREQVFGTSLGHNKNLVVLSGDTHNAWANNLTDLRGNKVGVEFATPGVTSPGLEGFFTENPLQVAAGLENIIGPLVYADTSRRGFMVVTATQDECRCDWHYVSDVTRQNYSAEVGKSLRVLPGQTGRSLVSVEANT